MVARAAALLLLLCLALPAAAQNCDYWVAPSDAGGSGSTCSYASPCTFGTVWGVMGAADTVCAVPGDYLGSVSAANMILPGGALASGAQILCPFPWDNGCYIDTEWVRDNALYLTSGDPAVFVSGFTFQGSRTDVSSLVGTVRIDGNGSTLDNAVIGDTQDSGYGSILDRADNAHYQWIYSQGIARKVCNSVSGRADGETWSQAVCVFEGTRMQAAKSAYAGGYNTYSRHGENIIAVAAANLMAEWGDYAETNNDGTCFASGCSTKNCTNTNGDGTNVVGALVEEEDAGGDTDLNILASFAIIPRTNCLEPKDVVGPRGSSIGAVAHRSVGHDLDGIEYNGIGVWVNPGLNPSGAAAMGIVSDDGDEAGGSPAAGSPKNIFRNAFIVAPDGSDFQNDGTNFATTSNIIEVDADVDSVPPYAAGTVFDFENCRMWRNGIDVGPLWPWPMDDRIAASTARFEDAGHAHEVYGSCDSSSCYPTSIVQPHTKWRVTANIVKYFGEIPYVNASGDVCRWDQIRVN